MNYDERLSAHEIVAEVDLIARYANDPRVAIIHAWGDFPNDPIDALSVAGLLATLDDAAGTWNAAIEAAAKACEARVITEAGGFMRNRPKTADECAAAIGRLKRWSRPRI